MGVRTGAKAAAVLFGALALTGCDGFLVPEGEGVPRAAGSSAAPASSSPTRGAAAPDGPGRPVAPRPDGATDGPSAPRSPRATQLPPATQDCPAGVRVDMGEIQAALMHRLATLTLTNCGEAPYRLSGRPSVKAYAFDGTLVDIEVNVREEGKKADAEVVLPPGGVAYSRLDWRPYDGVEKAQTLRIAAGPGHSARSFALEEDVRMVDAFDVTPWDLAPPR
ncbi:DUF4232 domain-containing protein [Streptomyces sp. CA-294286]|uniref:DUF4232 domain-containing protein n=1 Tax=Streptomyces sp. CA-294286 TaxID=3240070 RepID=UPI003D91C486